MQHLLCAMQHLPLPAWRASMAQQPPLCHTTVTPCVPPHLALDDKPLTTVCACASMVREAHGKKKKGRT